MASETGLGSYSGANPELYGNTAPTNNEQLTPTISQAEIEQLVEERLFSRMRHAPGYTVGTLSPNPDGSADVEVTINPGEQYGNDIRYVRVFRTPSGLELKGIAKPAKPQR